MRKARNHKILCALLVIAIMISGICLGEIQASSYFSCKQESKIVAADSIKGEDSVYRNERLSQREVISSIRQVRNITRRIHSRAEFETELCQVDVEALPQKIHSIWAMDNDPYLGNQCKIAIITYIHKQDGEKA